MEEVCKKIPEQYTMDVDSSDLNSEKLEKEIEEYERENGYKQPSSHTKYFLDDNGVLRQGRID
ncbi:hypothetical protein ATZ33_12370 [Enterococcus silesiacus]|uniref:Uncharacterized protein n=1 Tax=Enterococcus silesiacus TaxID=332949 RepID=A0ABN4J852_9ENTE|nr:hypothetical protein ATZ33_12370 [Enterococcus silesiacus]